MRLDEEMRSYDEAIALQLDMLEAEAEARAEERSRETIRSAEEKEAREREEWEVGRRRAAASFERENRDALAKKERAKRAADKSLEARRVQIVEYEARRH